MTAEGWRRKIRRPRFRLAAIVLAAVLCLVLSINVATAGSRAPRVLKTAAAPDAVALSPDGTTLYVAEGSRWLVPYRVATWRPGARVNLGGQAVQLVSVPDGRVLLALVDNAEAAGPGVVLRYHLDRVTVATGVVTALAAFAPPLNSLASDLALTSDGKTVYALEGAGPHGDDAVAQPVDIATGRLGAPISVPADTGAIALSPDGQTLYAGSGDNDLPEGTPGTVTAYRTGAYRTGSDPTGTYPAGTGIADPVGPAARLSTGSGDGTLTVTGLNVSPDGGELYVTAGYDPGEQLTVPGADYLFTVDTATGKTSRVRLTDDDDPDTTGPAVLSPDGRTLYVMESTADVIPVAVAPLTARPATVKPDLLTSSRIANVPNRNLTLAPDGQTLYVAQRNGVAILPLRA